MTRLETYLKQLDKSNYDFNDEHQINTELNEIAELLRLEGNNDEAELAMLNAEAFLIRKSFLYKNRPEEGQVKGLSYTFRGERTLEDGTVEPVFWPDVTQLTNKDFEYFEERYDAASNLYVKTQYGLLVYFGARTETSKHHEFKTELIDNLMQLSKNYYAKRETDFNYARHASQHLELSWGVAKETILKLKAEELSVYMADVIESADITSKTEQWVLVSYSNVLAENYSLAQEYIDFKDIIKKNLEAAKEREIDDLHGALYIADLCVRIAQKKGEDRKPYLAYKAKIYERLAINAEAQGNMAVVHFAEKALLLYKRLKMENDSKRLEEYYKRVRGQIEMSEMYFELPDEYSERIDEQIKSTVEKSTEREILNYFIATPWYRSIAEIKILAEQGKKQAPLKAIVPIRVMDKFGNTIAQYITDEERDEFTFWDAYGFHFQLDSQTMHRFFMEAYKNNKLSYSSTIEYLESTWLNEPIIRSYFGNQVEIIPLDTIKPGLKTMFSELQLFDADNEHPYDTITVIDSLTLKIEGLLRIFCERIDIPTFKPRRSGDKTVLMEKLLDDLLADIAHKPKWSPERETGFDEEDRIMLKYTLSEKAGLNLRNKVAHGLMDYYDYSFQFVVILFSLILKLSKYSFTEIKGGSDDSKSK